MEFFAFTTKGVMEAIMGMNIIYTCFITLLHRVLQVRFTFHLYRRIFMIKYICLRVILYNYVSDGTPRVMFITR